MAHEGGEPTAPEISPRYRLDEIGGTPAIEDPDQFRLDPMLSWGVGGAQSTDPDALEPDTTGLGGWTPMPAGRGVEHRESGGAVAEALAAHWWSTDAPPVRLYRGAWWAWSGNVWTRLESGLDPVVRRSIGVGAVTDGADKPLHVHRSLVAEIECELASRDRFVMAPDAVPGGSIYGPGPTRPVIPLATGDLQVTPGGCYVNPADETRFTTYRLAATWDGHLGERGDPEPERVTGSLWRRLLRETWPGDPASQALACQWLGALAAGLPPGAPTGLLEISGRPGTGKSVLLRVANALVGGASAAVDPAALGGRFDLWHARDAPLIIVDDVTSEISAQGIGRLLSATTGGALAMEGKGLPTRTVVIPGRIMLATNRPLSWGGAAAPMDRRIVRLRMDQVPEAPDPDLVAALTEPASLSVIVRDAARGLRLLLGYEPSPWPRDGRGWIIPPYAEALAEDATPVLLQWWTEHAVEDPGGAVGVMEALAAWQASEDLPLHRRSNGLTERKALVMDLKALVPGLKTEDRVPRGGGRKRAHFVGWRLLD